MNKPMNKPMRRTRHFYAMEWSLGRAVCANTGGRYGVTYHSFPRKAGRDEFCEGGGDFTSSPNWREPMSSQDYELVTALGDGEVVEAEPYIVPESPDDYYEGDICCRSGVSKVDGSMIITFEVFDGFTPHKKRVYVDMKAMQFLEWFGKEDIDDLKTGVKQYVDAR